jgi:hypothetical protein
MGLLGDFLTGGSGSGGILSKAMDKFQKKKKQKKDASKSNTDDPGAPGGTDSYHRGGKVRKTGLARLRKGEHVLTAKQYKSRRKTRSK